MKAKYLWLDLETTGLDPHAGQILECAAIVTDVKLTELGRVHGIIHCPAPRGDEFVQRMHTGNGLWEACKTGAGLATVMSSVLDLIASYDWTDRKPILAGLGIHFDRSWLNVHAPGVVDALHYRMLDMRSIIMFLADHGMHLSKQPSTHRAVDDIEYALNVARFIAGGIVE